MDLYKFYGKWILRSHPDAKGRMLFSNDKKASVSITSDYVFKQLDGDCSERLRRPAMGLVLQFAVLQFAVLHFAVLHFAVLQFCYPYSCVVLRILKFKGSYH